MFKQEETARIRRNAEKLGVMKALLASYDSAFMHFNPQIHADRLLIPTRLREQEHVVFQIGLNMAIPIPDLSLDDEGFSGTLSFRGAPFFCHVPWDCVYALMCDTSKGRLWAEDAPASIVASASSRKEAPERRPALEAIDGDLETRKTSQYLKPVKRERPTWMKVIEGEKK